MNLLKVHILAMVRERRARRRIRAEVDSSVNRAVEADDRVSVAGCIARERGPPPHDTRGRSAPSAQGQLQVNKSTFYLTLTFNIEQPKTFST